MVPTPIGNLNDMTPRAIQVLNEVDLILAEDTRTSKKLLDHFGISTAMHSHHKFNEHSALDNIASQLQQGAVIALITDAGTPGISDPGFLLARECRNRDIEIETLPGATAFTPALINSGLPCERFVFEGFLPQKKGRQSRLEQLADEPRTMIFYESPLRLVKTLQQFAETFGSERLASVSREISKVHDTTIRGDLKQLIEHFSQFPPKGEIVIIVAGKPEQEKKHFDKYAKFKNKNIISEL